MPAVALKSSKSSGHGCFPPTGVASTPVKKTKINGEFPLVNDSSCLFVSHVCGNTTHAGATRSVSSGASKTFIEGKPAARIGDDISCGDAIAKGSNNTFIE